VSDDQHDQDDEVTPIDRPARPADDPRRRRSRAHDIPRLADAADDLASLLDLLDREPDPEVGALVERSQRKRDDPAVFGDIAKLLVELRRERTGNRQRERDMEVVLREPHAAVKSSRRHMYVAITFAAMSVAAAVKQWGDHVAAPSPPTAPSVDTVRIQQLGHDLDRVDTELRELRQLLGRRSELLPPHAAGDLPALTLLAPSFSKGNLP